MSIRTMPRSRARRRMLSSSGPAKIPGKSVKRSNRRRGSCVTATDSDSDINRVFVWLPRAQDHQDLGRCGLQGSEDEIGTKRSITGLGLVATQPDRSHSGTASARHVEAE